MKPTKRIAVIYTLVQGRKNYVARTERTRTLTVNGIRVTRYTTDAQQAKEFENEVEAEDFIPKIINPSGRVFTAGTETIDVEKQGQKSREEALT